MRPVIELLKTTVGSVDDVLAYNTLSPLASRFIPPEDFRCVEAHFLNGPVSGLQAKQGMAGPRSGWARHRLLRCVQCLEEDIGCCGRPFWRRDHLLPGSMFCGLHGLPLYEACELCMDYEKHPERVLHAGYHCGCGLKPIAEVTSLSDKHAETEVEVARIASRLLDPGYLPHLNHASVAKAIAEAAMKHRLIRDGRFFWDTTKEYFAQHALRPLVERTGISIERSQTFGDILKGRQFLRHPIQAIGMLRALNDSWDHVEEIFMNGPNLATIATQSSPDRRMPRKDWTKYHQSYISRHYKSLFSRYASQYDELRRARPELSHVQLMRLLPTTANDVLTENSLAEAGYDVPMVLKNGVRNQALAEMLVEYIDTRGESLRASRYPHRIDHGALQRGFVRPKALHGKGMAEKLVGVPEALKRNAETPAEWRARIASYERPAKGSSIPHFRRSPSQSASTVANS